MRAALARALVRPGKAAAISAGMLAVVILALTIAARTPAWRSLPGLPGQVGLDYSPDAFGSLGPLSDEFVAEALGPRPGGLPLDDGRPPPPGSPSSQHPRKSSTNEVAARPPQLVSEGQTSPQPGGSRPQERGPVGQAVAPGAWDLHVTMLADRTTVRRGQEIIYRVTVVNAGTGVFEGDFANDAHIPFGTSSSQPVRCDAADEHQTACSGLAVTVPGAPERVGMHAISYRAVRVRLVPGATFGYSFAVEVDPTAPRRIANHAHVQVAGTAQATSDTVTVEVA